MQQRRGTAQQWTDADPILAAGEIGFETDTGQFKIGDGTNHWADISYFKNLEDLGGSLDDYILLTEKGVANGVATLNGQGRIPLGQLADLVSGAPEVLDTLGEIADAVQVAQTALTSVDGALDVHAQKTTDVHGIADVSQLVTSSTLNTAVDGVNASITAHANDTTNIHGIADTSDLITTSALNTAIQSANDDAAAALNTAIDSAIQTAAADASTKATAAQTAAGVAASSAISDHNSDTTNVHGITDTANLVYTNDSRLTDERTPLDYSVTDAKISTNGLSQASIVDLTSDLSAKAPLVSPALTGTPTAPTATSGTNTTQIATTAFVQTAVSDLVASAPSTLNTLNELAAALGNDPNFATTIVSDLATKITQQDLDTATLVAFNAQASNYTLALSDATNMVELTSSSANTVTIPTNASVAFPIGTAIDIFQRGTGQVTIAGSAGVTVLYTPGLKLRAQYSAATAIKRDTNTWIVTGDLTA